MKMASNADLRLRCRAKRLSVVVGLLLVSRSAHAQGSPPDFTMPNAPAMTYLGASTAKVSRPASGRDLAVALADGVDSLGRAQRGVAIDFALWSLLPFRVGPEYRKGSGPAFIYGNTQLSFATVRTTGDTSSTDLAIGIKTNFVNHADPLTDSELRRKIAAAIDGCMRTDATGRPQGSATEDCADKAASALVSTWLDSAGNWNRLSWSAAAAFGLRFRESFIGRSYGRGGAAWTTVGIPLWTPKGQLLIQARYDLISGGASAPDTSALSGGLRASFGGSRFNSYAELVCASRNHGSNRIQTTKGLGIELKAGDQTWISTGVGTSYDAKTQGDRVVILAGLHWNLSSGPQLGR